MTALVVPHLGRAEEWLEMAREFEPGLMHGSGFWGQDQPVFTSEGFDAYVARVLESGDPDVPPPPDRVKCSYFWITDDAGALVGYLALRWSLNDFLLEEGGHIGYSVRPSRRREGHATRALALGVQEARRLGIERVLVTCDYDNEASRRTIELNGGVLEDQRGEKLRYWI